MIQMLSVVITKPLPCIVNLLVWCQWRQKAFESYLIFSIWYFNNFFISQIYLVFCRMFLFVTTLPGAGDDSGVGEDEDEDGG